MVKRFLISDVSFFVSCLIISYFKNVVYFILSDITNWPKLVERKN